MIFSVFWNKQKKEVVINPSRYSKVSFLEDGIEPKSYDAALFFTSIASYYIGLPIDAEDDTDAESSDDVEALDGGGGVNVGGAVALTCLYIFEEYQKYFEEFEEQLQSFSIFLDTPTETDSDSNASTETVVYNFIETETYEGKIFSLEAFLKDSGLKNANVPSCSPSKLLEFFLEKLEEIPTYDERPFKKQRRVVQSVTSAQQPLKF